MSGPGSASRNRELHTRCDVKSEREFEWMNRGFPTQHFVDECALTNLVFSLFILEVL